MNNQTISPVYLDPATPIIGINISDYKPAPGKLATIYYAETGTSIYGDGVCQSFVFVDGLDIHIGVGCARIANNGVSAWTTLHDEVIQYGDTGDVARAIELADEKLRSLNNRFNQ